MFIKPLFFTFLLSVLSLTSFGIVKADFSSDKSSGCPALVVNFTDASVGALTLFWDFGNKNTSTLKNPSATFLNPGTYTVRLIARGETGADTIDKAITVFKLPVADFHADKPNACSYDSVHFYTDITLGDAPITNYAWGFGNGVATSDSVPAYKFLSQGAYSITLVVQDSNKCSASKTAVSYIHVVQAPTAAFSASPTSSCDPTQFVSFKNASTGNGLSYFWNLDPTNTSTLRDPTFTYHQQKYKVLLTVTDVNGCNAQAATQITANSLSADFTASSVLVCTGQKIQFNNASNFPGKTWLWNFGDGTTSNVANPQKKYAAAGIYDVSFKITDGTCQDSTNKPKYINVRQGANMQPPTITADTTQSCTPPLTVNFVSNAPGAVDYLWDFGDGNSSLFADPTNTFTTASTFTISLSVMDSDGCITSASFPNFISTTGPAIKISSSVGCPGTPLAFSNKTAGGKSYAWDFGDNSTSTDPAPKHLYSNYGSYLVKLTAVNGIGCVSNDSMPVTIDSIHVDFNVNSTFSPCPPLVGLFQNTSWQSGLNYQWYLGDGYTDTTTNPTHIYFYPGVYTVKLIGVAPTGCTDTVIYKDLITVQGPTANFSSNPPVGCLPVDVTFKADLSDNTKSVWSDMGDGTVILDSTNFIHTYTQEGIFHPQFVLTDHVGCVVSYPIDSVITHSRPMLAIKDTSVCGGSSVRISLDTAGTGYLWAPATALSCDTCRDVTILSPDTITYQVIATNVFGCQTYDTFTVNVDPLPHLLPAATVHLCATDSLRLFMGNATKVAWAPAQFLDDSASSTPLCIPINPTNYTITGYNELGCSVSTTMDIQVQSKVSVSVTPDLTICENDTTQLHSVLNFGSDLGVKYSWSPAQYLDTASNLSPFAYLKNKTVDFRLIATSGNCQPDTETVVVHVNPIPDIEVSDPVTTTPYGEVSLYAASHQELSYTWYSPDSMSCRDCKRTDLYPSSSQTVYVKGTNQIGCSVRDSVVITVTGCDQNSIYLPNTFTPNGDGMNDKFYIRTNALSSIKYFRIFDAWGGVVYESNQLNQGWDGSTNGKDISTGVYVYVLEGTCENGMSVIKSGNVTAIR